MVELASFRTPVGNAQPGSSRLDSNESTYWTHVRELVGAFYDDGPLPHYGVGGNLDHRESALRELTEAHPTDWSYPLLNYGMVAINSASTMVLSGAIGVVRPREAIPKPPQVPSSMHPLQEWEGWVVETDEHEFLARLTDLTAPDPSVPDFAQEEDAIIPNSEIADDDLERLRPGNVFRWVIGYERSPSGAKRRVSQIVFRDLPVVTAKDVARGQEWARKISRALGD